MKKKDDTLKAAILDYARDIITKEGPESISIRLIAKNLGIATGTFYNYFENKNEILLALTEEYWRSTLVEMQAIIHSDVFYTALEEIYDFLYQQVTTSAGILMSSLQDAEAIGKSKMKITQRELQKNIIVLLDQDKGIRQEIWTSSFTQQHFAGFIMSNMMMNLRIKSDNIDFIIEIVKRILY